MAHLPLAEAVKTYAVHAMRPSSRRCSRRSSGPLKTFRWSVSCLIARRFSRRTWSIKQAYRFLQDAPRMEEAGVVVRLPDWWSARRPRAPKSKSAWAKANQAVWDSKECSTSTWRSRWMATS